MTPEARARPLRDTLSARQTDRAAPWPSGVQRWHQAGEQAPMSDMRRRQFIALVGGAAVAWPLAARAQQAAKMPTIGYLGAGTPSFYSQWVAAFVQRLREFGWIDGRNIGIEYRWAEGRSERYTEIATEFVRRNVDVIVAHGNAAVVAAKQATSIIPIVFPVAGDPLGTGLVSNLARPGGNVTGLSLRQTDLAAKRLELLREVVCAG
jgi:putative tryptophan/tyrosine transport system substrate-binding protein